MNDDTTPSSPPSEPEGRRGISAGAKLAIAIAVVIVLAGGGYAIYKLTNKTEQQPAFETAKEVFAALESGDTAAAEDRATEAGATALAAIGREDLDGLAFSGCSPYPGEPPTRVCTWTRPGGQLTIALELDDKKWLVTKAEIGPAGLPPETDDSAPAG
jgi:hypothetical protein